MAVLCSSCGSSERVSRVTGEQSFVKCGRCGKIHHLLIHPGVKPDFFVQAPMRAEAKPHPHIYVSVMLAFFAVVAILLFIQVL